MEKSFSIDDSEFAKPKFSKVCTLCVHFNVDSALEKKRTCEAFPQGIPDEIFLGQNNHRSPYKGDNGIQFKLHPDAKVTPDA